MSHTPLSKAYTTAPFILKGEELELHPLKALWWPARRTLIVSDVHVGKAGHFAAHGMPVPLMAFKENCWNLSLLYDTYCPERVLFLGDLFHSRRNAEWDIFYDFSQNYPQLDAVLIRGNHDSLADDVYTDLGLTLVDSLEEGPFRLVHEPEEGESERYRLCGHIHPAVRLKGGNDSMRLPCYWFGKFEGVMPAFGSLTGTHRVKPKKGDSVFVSTGKEVVRV